MPFDWSTGGLAAGLACYRSQEFFEAHEHWEGVWNNLTGLEKIFLQALIQVTVAMHHYQQRNLPGAQSLLSRALQKLDRCPEPFAGVDVAGLAAELRGWLNALESPPTSLPEFPVIRLMDPECGEFRTTI